MAQEIAIRGTNEEGKLRGPVAVIFLSLIPLYGLFYYYFINKELAELGKARGTTELGESPMLSVLAVAIGWVLLFIPPLVSLWGTWKRQDNARKMFGVNEGVDHAPGFIIYLIFSPLGLYFLQRGQNGVLEAQARA
jgi:hypothetical protein